MLTLDKVYHAAFKLKEVIRPTDLIHAPQINPDADVYLKTENLQVTGSFKVRGAYYKISTLTDEEKKHGVIACSAGNHAQGVALAAQRSGIKSIICLPDGAPISKVEATRSYGAEICLVEGVYDDAYNKALQLRDEHGYTFIHPFNDEDVIAGQGTIGLELLEQLDDRRCCSAYRRRRTYFGRCFHDEVIKARYKGIRRSGGRRTQYADICQGRQDRVP